MATLRARVAPAGRLRRLSTGFFTADSGVRLLEAAAVVLILALAAWLRLSGLAANPDWDINEGYNLSIARNMLEGQAQMLAVRQVFIQHPPLFYALVAIAGLVEGGATIWTARLVAALLATIAVVPLYLLARRVAGVRAAVLAAATYSVAHIAVLHGRFANTYSLLLPGLPLLCWLLLLVEERSSRLRLCALGATMAFLLLAERIAIPAVAVALLWLLRRAGWRRALAAGSLAVLPSALYLFPLALSQPEVFWLDLLHTGGRVSSGPVERFIRLIATYAGFLTIDIAMPVGLAGMFALLGRRGGLRVLLVAIATLVLSLLIRDPRAQFRQAVPLLPLLYLGVGVALDLGVGLIWRRTRRAVPFAALTFLLLIPFGIEGARSGAGVAHGFRPGLVPVLAKEDDARAAARALDERLTRDELVIADAHVAWLLRTRVADWAQAGAATGEAVAFYPAGMGQHHFAYDARLEGARAAVVDDFVRALVEEEPSGAVAPLYREVTSRWQWLGSYGQFAVYMRP